MVCIDYMHVQVNFMLIWRTQEVKGLVHSMNYLYWNLIVVTTTKKTGSTILFLKISKAKKAWNDSCQLVLYHIIVGFSKHYHAHVFEFKCVLETICLDFLSIKRGGGWQEILKYLRKANKEVTKWLPIAKPLKSYLNNRCKWK